MFLIIVMLSLSLLTLISSMKLNIGGNNETTNIAIINNICSIMNSLFPNKKKDHLELFTVKIEKA